MAMKPLLGRQSEILNAITAYIEAHGHPPTTKRLCAMLNMHRGALQRSIDKLVERGYLARLPVGTLQVRLPTGTRARAPDGD